MKKNNKTIIKTIELMSDDYIKRDEILKLLAIKESTFYKQIKLLKKAGFNIKRKKDFYHLMNFKNTFEIQDFEKSIFAYLLSLACVSLSERKLQEFFDTIEKILYFSDKETYNEIINKFNNFRKHVFDDFYGKKIKILQDCIEQQKSIKVYSTSKRCFYLKPLNFEYGIKKIYVNFLNLELKEAIRMPIEKINKIVLYNPIYEQNEKRETVFELYGKLAKTYILKEDERIVNRFKDKLIVANSSSDKKILFQRLLRYDILCKVILPKKDVVAFLKLVEQSIQNIGT